MMAPGEAIRMTNPTIIPANTFIRKLLKRFYLNCCILILVLKNQELLIHFFVQDDGLNRINKAELIIFNVNFIGAILQIKFKFIVAVDHGFKYLTIVGSGIHHHSPYIGI